MSTSAFVNETQQSEFVVDSAASMHMQSRKNLNSAELDTVRLSRNPTTIITDNGEVQTNEEASVYVNDVELHGSEKSEDDNKDIDLVRGNLLRDLPERLENFTEIRVAEGVSASRDTPASISREPAPEPPRKMVSGKNSIFTYIRRTKNCEVCKRTRKTRALCRKSIGTAVPRAETFSDLTTADHIVLSEGCGSRINHRYAFVVQDLATQMIQSHPCKTKSSQETERSLRKFLVPSEKPSYYTDSSLEFGKSCEDLPSFL